MAASALDLTLSSPEDSAAALREPFVTLEQIVPAETAQYASMADVYALWLAAATGTSARTLRPNGCPIEFSGSDVIVRLGFCAWPSDPDLVFTLAAALGELSTWQLVEHDREFSVFVNNSDIIDLPYFMLDMRVTWETPTFDRRGNRIPAPTITDTGTRLQLSSEVFGAARISGSAVGYYVESIMTLSRKLTSEEVPIEEIAEQQHFTDEGTEYFITSPIPATRLNGYKVENLQNAITAAWPKLDGTLDSEQLRLKIPKCVEDALALCPGMYQHVLRWCDTVTPWQAYYNACNGKMIGVWPGDNPTRYCSQIIMNEDPGPWLRGLL